MASLVAAPIECCHPQEKSKKNIKILVLIIASDNYPVYVELQKVWRSYMHYNPKQVQAYFMKSDPNLPAMSLIADDVIWSKTSETLAPGIINKTIQSMEALLPRIKTEFDYVLRTNLSSFYAFDRLLDFLQNMPAKNVYCGTCYGEVPGGASGSGYILSSDMAELLVQNKSYFYNQLPPDDVLVANFFKSKNIAPIHHERMDLMPLKVWENNKYFIPSGIFQFRVKNEPHLRLTDDVYVHNQLAKKFYQTKMSDQVPKDWQEAFDRAQACGSIGDLPKAIYWYKQSTHLSDSNWQKYIAYYCLAQEIETLSANDIEYDWSQAMNYYLKAYEVGARRAEPLIKIASHYIAQGNNALAFLFAKSALELPYPDEHARFVQKDMYDFTRDEILGRCAWYVQEYEVGQKALRNALKKYPHNGLLARNLMFYLDREFECGTWSIQSVDLHGEQVAQKQQKKWSILLCTTDRTAQLEQILIALKKQIKQHHLEDKIEILLFEDRGECPMGYKRNKLLQASQGEYICFVEIDDIIHDNYIKMMYQKLPVENGASNVSSFINSPEYNSYFMAEGVFNKIPNYVSPVERNKAIKCKFTIAQVQ